MHSHVGNLPKITEATRFSTTTNSCKNFSSPSVTGACMCPTIGSCSPEAVTSCSDLVALTRTMSWACERTSRCTSEMDDPESSISSTGTPPNLPVMTAAFDFMTATVTTLTSCGPIEDGGACCPTQASPGRFPDGTLWRDVQVDHT